jgi:hypothetical protein
MSFIEYNGKMYDARHGGPFDRGSADAYYGRLMDPHYYLGDTAMSERIGFSDMSNAHVKAYVAGYESTPFAQKDYG